MKSDNQSATRNDLKEIAELIINQLRGEMREQGEQLRGKIQDQGDRLQGEMRSLESALRDEFDTKLTAAKNELKNHTEEVVAEHNTEVLQAIASVVEPIQETVKKHGRRLSRLEHKAA